jgi:hypothetical protein
MSNSRRIIIAITVIALFVGAILAIEIYRERRGPRHAGPKLFSDGCIPVHHGKKAPSAFCPDDTAKLAKTGFIEKKENKLQEGWLLKDVLLLYLKNEDFSPETVVQVESSSRKKKVDIRWKDLSNDSNRIILSMTKQGRLKLASKMKGLDAREQWVQEVDRIEVIQK